MPQQVSVNLGANPAGFIAGMRAAGAAAEGLDAKTAATAKGLKLLGGAFIAVEVVKGFTDAAKAAGNYQAQIVRLKTDANESASNLKLVSRGLLDLAGSTGTSTDALTAGMYKIESAGIHGADALNVAKAAAEGAKVGFADMTTVADALTTAMTNYNIPAAGATATTNELIAAVSRGKTDLESLSASMSTVAPVAHAAGIGLDETLGAMSTMTAQGTNSAKAATYLAQTIRSLSAPTQKSTKELEAIGLSAADLSTNLGKDGLANTLDTIVAHIKDKMGPAGEVMLTNLQHLSGKTSDFQKILADVPPGMQSYVQALALGTGTTKTLQAVLELTNGGTKTFRDNTKAAADAAKHAGSDVHDWDVVQKNFNQRLSEAGGQFEKVKIALGQDLLPLFTAGATKLADFGKWLGKYPGWVEGITFSLAGAGGLILSLKLLNGAIDVVRGTMARTIGLRAASTGSLLAESAAADKAAASITRLDIAEAGGAAHMTRLLGQIGGAAAGAEAGGAAATGMSAAALGAAIAAPIVLSLGATFLAYKSSQKEGPPSYKAAVVPGAGYVPGMGAIPGSVPNQKEIADALAKYATSQGQNTTVKFTGQDRQTRTEQEGRFAGALIKEGAAAALTATQVDQLVQAQNKLPAATTNLTNLIQKQTAAFSVLNTAGQNAVVANENYQASIAGLNNSVKENGTSLDETTAKGRANTDAIIAQAGAINEVDTAFFQAREKTKGYAGALTDVTAKLAGQKQALIDQATRLGISHDQAKKLVDQILKTPKQVTTDFNSPQLTAMSKKVADLQNQINQLTGKPYYVTVNVDTKGTLASTYGSQVPNGKNAAAGYAGGMGSSHPQVRSSAKAMAKAASDEVAKFNEAQSPSKLYHRHGYNTGTGLAKGTKESSKHAEKAAKDMAKAATHELEKELKLGTTAAIKAMSKQISIDSKSLTKWKHLLTGARGDRDNAESAAKGIFTATGDLSQIVGQTTKGTTTTNWDGTTSTTADVTAPVTAADINSSLTATLGKDRQFLADWKRAKRIGLKEPYASQILGYGPETGEPILQAILAGGKAEVNTVNTLEGGITQVGNEAAKAAGAPYAKDIAKYIAEVQKLTAALAKENAARDKARSINLTITTSDTDKQLKAVEQALAAAGIKVNLKVRAG